MPTLKAVINLVSGNLFPAPVNFTETVTETINGNHSSFQTNVIANSSSSVLFSSSAASGASGVLYFYFKASSTNASTVDIEITTNSGPDTISALRLTPGDVAYLPIDASDSAGIQVEAYNNSVSSAATIQYFYGEKG
jgi:hypothetical protein